MILHNLQKFIAVNAVIERKNRNFPKTFYIPSGLSNIHLYPNLIVSSRFAPDQIP